MVTILGGLLVVVGLIATVAQVQNKIDKQKFPIYLVLVASVLLLSSTYFAKGESESSTYTLYLFGVVAIGCILALLSRKSTSLWWAAAVPLTTIGIFFIPDNIEFLKYPLSDTMYIFLLALAASLAPIIIHFAKLGLGNSIIKFGKTQWKESEEDHLESLISFAYVGLTALLAGNLLSSFGLLLVLAFTSATTFVGHGKLGINSKIAFSTIGALALVSVAPIIIEYTGFTNLDLLQPKLLQGLFVGGFILVYYHLLLKIAKRKEGKWRTILVVKTLMVCLTTFSMLGITYMTKESVGGSDAMVVCLLAIAFGSVAITLFEAELSVPLKLLALGTTLIFIPYSSPSLESQEESLIPVFTEQSSTNKGEPTEEVTYVDLATKDGNYIITADSSTVNFELGPKNTRTKGRIKKPNGKLVLNNDLSQSYLEVTLQVNQLSTYNSIRDEHLMSDEYFSEAKFPEMKFISNSITQRGQSYVATGEFQMLKKKVPMVLSFDALEYGEKIVLTGTSHLNRTDFGMAPDPKIGDEVEFTFSALFTK